MTNEELVVRIQAGESDLIGELWEQNTGIFYLKAYNLYTLYYDRCASSGVELDDIFQVCFLALLDAVQAFQADGEYKFLSYIKFPLLNRFKALVGIRTSKRDPLDHAGSLNETIGGDGDTERLDMLVDPNSAEPFEGVIDDVFQSELRNALDEGISRLPENRARAIRGRWLEGKTQGQIAAEMGVAYQRIHTLEREGLRRLRDYQELQAFHDEILTTAAYHGTGFAAFKETGASSVEKAVIKAESYDHMRWG